MRGAILATLIAKEAQEQRVWYVRHAYLIFAESSEYSVEYSQGWSFRNRGRRVGRSQFLTALMRNWCETLIFDSNF